MIRIVSIMKNLSFSNEKFLVFLLYLTSSVFGFAKICLTNESPSFQSNNLGQFYSSFSQETICIIRKSKLIVSKIIPYPELASVCKTAIKNDSFAFQMYKIVSKHFEIGDPLFYLKVFL